MTLDDELRRRLQQAADRAAEGTDAGAITGAVAAKVGSGGAAGGAAGPWKLFGGLGAAGLLVGGALGFTALRPADDDAATPVVVAAEVRRTSLYDCPAGSPSGAVHPGDRLFAVGRNDDGGWLAVRAIDGGIIRWLPTVALDADDDRELAVLTCTETIILNTGPGATDATSTTTSTPTTTSTAPPTSTTVPATVPATVPPTVPPTAPPTTPTTTPPTSPPDTQKPSVQASSNVDEIVDSSGPACDNEAILTAFANDNVGVTSVTGTWSGLPGSPKAFAKGAGNTWTMQFGPFSGLGLAYNQLITITITAKDAAGNTQSTTVPVRVFGECLG